MNSIKVLNKDSIKLLEENNLLHPLIKNELKKNIIKEVNVENDIEKEAINTFLLRIGIDDSNKYDAFLKSNNLTNEDVSCLALQKQKLKIYLLENYAHQIETKFLDRKNNLDIFVYSLIRVKDSYKAKELYMRLIGKEENFDELAFQHSEGPEKITRGIVGPSSIESAHRLLAKSLRIAKIGEIMPPLQINIQNGMAYFLIVRLEFHKPAKLDELMREKLGLEIFDKWLNKEADIYLDKILSEFKVNKHSIQSSGIGAS